MSTLFEILGIDWTGQDVSDVQLKKAYHEALLQWHPDKLQSASAGQRSVISVADIRKAFAVLSDPDQKKSYISRLQGVTEGLGARPGDNVFIDLGDMHEAELTDGTFKWTWPCRCGNDEGYTVTEQDLVNNGSHVEIRVPCNDCSLWITIQYAEENP